MTGSQQTLATATHHPMLSCPTARWLSSQQVPMTSQGTLGVIGQRALAHGSESQPRGRWA